MRKIIAAINMTIDGVLDHTAGIPDEEIHNHYSELIDTAGVILYGRKTFELMKFWKTLVETPSGEKEMDDFAQAINKVQKVVFSSTLTDPDWESATLSHDSLEDSVKALKEKDGKPVLIGSRSLILQLMKYNLIDEFQLCIHPVVAGSGELLFEPLKDRTLFKLIKTKTFEGGAVILYLVPKM